jgi:hypothetical protein
MHAYPAATMARRMAAVVAERFFLPEGPMFFWVVLPQPTPSLSA